MIELMILGFLAEGPMHGYELRRRMEHLQGHTNALSDGTVYPAIKRLIASGALTAHDEAGARAAPRRTLHLTDAGRVELLARLRDAHGHDITDLTRFYVVLSFLSLLPHQGQRNAVLRRRLEFLEQPASFFYDGARPLRADQVDDPYRRGMMISAQALSRAERAWIRDLLAETSTIEGADEEEGDAR